MKAIAFGEQKQAKFFLQTMLHCTFRRQADLK
jgi:hypothetical protein